MRWPSPPARTLAAVLAGLVLVGAGGLVALDRRLIYLIGGPHLAHAALSPKVIATGLPARQGGVGSLITADLDGDSRRDFIITGSGHIAAYAATGTRLWRHDAAIQLTETAEEDGLPGLHAPGAQAADIDGDLGTEVLFLTSAGTLQILEGRSGAARQPIRLPPPPAGAERWEHLAVADFRRRGERDLLLQATNAEGYRMGRYLAAYPIEGLLQDGPAAAALWQRDDFLALAHSGARLADLDGDGRHEVLGGDIVGPDGERLVRLPVEGHLDSIFVADMRPDLAGLEVVALEENGPERVFLYNREGLIWATHHRHQEPQNAAVGDFDPDRPGLEIWCRSRYDRHQRPWLLDARGELIAEYEMAEVAPRGWTVKGVEEISTIAWSGAPKQLAAAKERHEPGEVALFDPLSGAFVLRLDEQADRLYVADVSGDWREEIIVLNAGELRIYENPAANPAPARPSLWSEDHYRRSKLIWNYYNP